MSDDKWTDGTGKRAGQKFDGTSWWTQAPDGTWTMLPGKPKDFSGQWWRENQTGCLLMLILGVLALVAFVGCLSLATPR